MALDEREIVSPLFERLISPLCKRLTKIGSGTIDPPGGLVDNELLSGDQAPGETLLSGDQSPGVVKLSGNI